MKVGDKIKALTAFSGVPIGTEGYVIGDYGSGFMVGWDLPERPYPKDRTPHEVNEMWAINPECPLRDGFDKETELNLLQIISYGGID